MSFLKKLFGGGSEEPKGNDSAPKVANSSAASHKTVKFGRFTDCNKDSNQMVHWDKCIKAFQEKRYVDSYEAFLNYVKDHELDNVTISRNGDQLKFELIQGSNVIHGIGSGKDFVAYTNIASMDTPSIPVMRKLMSINYGLKYSKFALDGTSICMKFSSHAIDASPNKLYAGLKELAKKADQQDDLLISEFSSLKEMGGEHVAARDQSRVDIKYKYLTKWLNETKDEVSKMNFQKDAGGISFLLLDLSYKIDYLIAPQGVLTNSLELIQVEFFKKSKATTAERNTYIIKEFEAIMAQPKEKIVEGLYDVACTFGIANAANHKTVMDKISKEREKVAWYRDNGFPQVQQAVYGYMVSYAFFNYGMKYPITDLLNIAMHVLTPDYYREMGDENQFVGSDGKLNGGRIKAAIGHIMAYSKKDYPFIQMNTATLNYTNPSNFIDSLLQLVDKVDLRKK
ncbi:MAG: hypothetical protein GQ574_06725 [Crocinitomix sp.]|nr:hypothetical protein [Crocinitomix sp.]